MCSLFASFSTFITFVKKDIGILLGLPPFATFEKQSGYLPVSFGILSEMCKTPLILANSKLFNGFCGSGHAGMAT